MTEYIVEYKGDTKNIVANSPYNAVRYYFADLGFDVNTTSRFNKDDCDDIVNTHNLKSNQNKRFKLSRKEPLKDLNIKYLLLTYDESNNPIYYCCGNGFSSVFNELTFYDSKDDCIYSLRRYLNKYPNASFKKFGIVEVELKSRGIRTISFTELDRSSF